jgi:hypothetical protein
VVTCDPGGPRYDRNPKIQGAMMPRLTVGTIF